MKKISSLKKNLIFSIAYQILLIFIPLITAPYISRVLGVENTGIFSYFYSISNYFVLFSMLGIMSYGVRAVAEVSSDKEKCSQLFWEIYSLQICTSLIAIGGYFFYLLFAVSEHEIIARIQCLYVISALFDISWFYNGISDFKSTVTRNLFVKVISIILIFLLVKTKTDLWIYTMIMCGGMLFSQLVLWLPMRKRIVWVKPTFKAIFSHLKPNLILFSSTVAVSIYKIMDKIMIGLLADYLQLGFYENAEKVINLPMGIIAAVGSVMLSKMSSMSQEEKALSENRSVCQTLTIMMALAIGLAFGISAVADNFAVLFFGVEFAETGSLLSYLAFVIVFITWGNVIRTQYLLPHKKDSKIVGCVWIGAAVNFIINLILLRYIGALGAVIGTLATEILSATLHSVFAGKALSTGKHILICIPYVLFGGIMFIAVKFLGEYFAIGELGGLLIQIGVGAVLYCALVILYWLVSKNKPNFLKRKGSEDN